jgi:DNA repair protein RecO (recombination protein O)
MSLVTTPAVVLQTYRYSETSKVVRLATRDLGVQSAIAKGALRPRSRFGAGLELLSEGVAQLYFRETRELHTLGAFDLVNLRRDLARDVGRFAGAAALAEVMVKMTPPAPLPLAYDTLTAALDALEAAPVERVDVTAMRALWRLVAVLGFEPSLTVCARDGAAIEPAGDEPVPFSVADGGVLCPRCLQAPSPRQPPSRLPPHAYRDLLALNDARVELPLPVLDPPHAAAHRRLVARFVRYHLAEAGSLSALDFWERHAWVPPSATRTPIPSAAS